MRYSFVSTAAIGENDVISIAAFYTKCSFTVPPMVWVPQQLVGSPLGATVTIECWLEAHPAALHYWARPDGQVLHDPTKYRIESINGVTAAVQQQHMTNGTRSSSYTVSSNNGGFHDKKSKIINLNRIVDSFIIYRQ